MVHAEAFVHRLRARAAVHAARIALPEAHDPRVLAAAAELHATGIVHPVLVLDPARPESHGVARALGVECVVPGDDADAGALADELLARRRGKGLTGDAAAALARDPLWFAADLVRRGVVDGAVAGCVRTTADVMRATLALVGRAPGISAVSSAFYMVTPPFRDLGEEVLTFTDCAVIPHPTAAQLAEIAIGAARDRVAVVGDDPVVAFLSFSTLGSADGESVRRVREAVALARALDPALPIDGELQGDAALIPLVGARKAPGHPVAGRANILVFPSLDAGNIAYKLVERIGGCAAIGPILQGLGMPCNDLSRGASTDDIINVAAVTALQAQRQRYLRRGTPGDNA